MSEQNNSQELLRQYIDSIKDQEERKKAEYLVRLSSLNIGIAVLLCLLMPFAGYCYTRRWKAFLYLICSCGLVGGVIGVTVGNNEKAIEKIFSIVSIGSPIAASIDNSLAISRATKKIKDIS